LAQERLWSGRSSSALMAYVLPTQGLLGGHASPSLVPPIHGIPRTAYNITLAAPFPAHPVLAAGKPLQQHGAASKVSRHVPTTYVQRDSDARIAEAASHSPVASGVHGKQSPQRILLLRHGESKGNITDRDVPDPLLTQTGRAQAESWQQAIGAFKVEVVLVSPLRRAVQTACLAFGHQPVRMELCRAAREFWWDQLENRILSSAEELQELLEGLPRGTEMVGVDTALRESPQDPPDEEASVAHLRSILAARPERIVAVVSHWGVLRALCGCDADNAEIFECEWGANKELLAVARHTPPINDSQCHCC